MMGVEGQASVEYAGLLALAAILGATLALIAGPPLVHVVRSALVAVLSGSASHPPVGAATAADIADVHSALSVAEDALTPDAVSVAIAQRHGREDAATITDALLLDAALEAAPWLREQRTYRAWKSISDGPYEEAAAATGGDRDVENPIGPPAATWITVAEQRRAITSLMAHHTSPAALALDTVGGAGVVNVMRGARRFMRVAVSRLPRAVDDAVTGTEVIDLVASNGGDIPPGARAGDIVVAWPAHRTFWRDGHADTSPLIDLGDAFKRQPAPRDYLHIVYLRPGPSGLAVIGEAIRA